MVNSYNESNYPDKLVAFIDILGFKDLVMQGREGALQTINYIDGHLKHVLNVLNDNYGKTFSTKLFSDCICVSCEYSKENIFYILYELAFIQLYFSLRKMFLRGALSHGCHFENERMVFSQGLIKAYELEQVAMYPRIIVDSTLVEQIINEQNPFEKKNNLNFIMESPDGYFFVDYLNMLYEDGMEQIEFLHDHKESIIENVNKNLKNIRILEKYRWIAEYHNYKFNEIFDADGWEDCYAAQVINETTIHMSSVFPYFKKA
ncbi:MAG: hypothetical protein HZA47_03950 [Planctomycetes bacterium]|uniref:hypothetical protein n=1 Tax=Candidatus Wunengus sp. YC65 TaxID=3367701 RepID=UPI001E07E3BE|nr:hypothetical protein [Planctomycetota bacterium]